MSKWYDILGDVLLTGAGVAGAAFGVPALAAVAGGINSLLGGSSSPAPDTSTSTADLAWANLNKNKTNQAQNQIQLSGSINHKLPTVWEQTSPFINNSNVNKQKIEGLSKNGYSLSNVLGEVINSANRPKLNTQLQLDDYRVADSIIREYLTKNRF